MVVALDVLAEVLLETDQDGSEKGLQDGWFKLGAAGLVVEEGGAIHGKGVDACEMCGDLVWCCGSRTYLEGETECRGSAGQHDARAHGDLAVSVEVHPWDAVVELLYAGERLLNVTGHGWELYRQPAELEEFTD